MNKRPLDNNECINNIKNEYINTNIQHKSSVTSYCQSRSVTCMGHTPVAAKVSSTVVVTSLTSSEYPDGVDSTLQYSKKQHTAVSNQ